MKDGRVKTYILQRLIPGNSKRSTVIGSAGGKVKRAIISPKDLYLENPNFGPVRSFSPYSISEVKILNDIYRFSSPERIESKLVLQKKANKQRKQIQHLIGLN